MKEFKNITEHKILTLAWFALLGRREKEREFEKSGSPVGKARVEEMDSQLAEINRRILELEGKA